MPATSEMSSTSQIHFRKISKEFHAGQLVLDQLSFNLEFGKCSALVGPSGCGKSTLLRILAGLERASSGEIHFGAQCWSSPQFFLPPEQRRIGMVFQSFALWPHMTVFENVAFPLQIQKLKKNLIQEKAHHILDLCKILPQAQRHPSSLSGGQQQRVSLARALVSNPQLLLLDEPFSSLDASLREELRHELKQIQKQLSVTSVLVSHDWDDAAALCHEVVVLNAGHIEQRGSVKEIENAPSSEFVRKLTKSK